MVLIRSKCEEYVDAILESRKPPDAGPAANEKEIHATPEETAKWLKAFGGDSKRDRKR